MKPWVIAFVSFLVTWGLTTHGKYSASGDEPHYLMVTQSLVADHDLDLRNNYDDDDGRLFGHRNLQMGPHARVSRTGHTRSIGDIGLPIALVPSYAIARLVSRVPGDRTLARFRMDRGLFTYSIVSLSIAALTAFALALLYAGLRQQAGDAFAGWTVLAAACSPPILSHAFLVFPESIALFVAAATIWLAFKVPAPRDDRWLLLLVLACGLLPWVHRKYSFFVVGLLFVVWWYREPLVRGLTRAQRWAAALAFIVPQLALHVWTIHEWGTLGGPQMLEGAPFSPASLSIGLAGLLVDREYGLLAYAPLYWILPACAWLAWRRAWPPFVAALLLYVPMAAFVEWWGGFSPAARYLVPTLPLVLPAIAFALRHRPVRIVFAALCLAQLAIDATVWQHPRALWPLADGVNPALERLGPVGRAYERVLPPFVSRIHRDVPGEEPGSR